MTQRPLMLITGASAGIGAAFARFYAEKGWNLALTARRLDRLRALKGAIAEGHDVDVHVLPADLSEREAVPALLAELARLGQPVDGLISNAGYGPRGSFTANDWADHEAAITVMASQPVRLAHGLLSGMQERGFGRIIHVSSVMGLISATPGATMYSPVKAFLMRFSEGLWQECHGTGVHVSALCPGLTRSEFHDVNAMRPRVDAIPRFLWQSAEAVVEAGWRGNEAGKPVIVPGAINKAMVGLHHLLPPIVARRLVARTMAGLRN
jgi:uncharacterized protein